MIGDGAINRIGPHLNGVVGRGIGAVEGYDFSDIFLEAAAQGETWTETARLTGSSPIPMATYPEPPWSFAVSARRRIAPT
jgi:cytochrome c2